MSFDKFCPGSKAVRNPTPEYYKCPNCGEEVEVWTHELSAPCHKCKTMVFRESRPSCIDWCQYAEPCLGTERYRQLKGMGKG